jgi:hypothetical protein
MSVQPVVQDEEQVIKRSYSYNDLLKFKDASTYSAIGKMRESNHPNQPEYSFGTATRDKGEKIYQSKELCKSQFLGKTSPGPNYEVRHTDKYYYKNEPTWTFNAAARNTLETGARYAHYHRADVDFDPITSDNNRRGSQGIVKIGLENRFPRSQSSNTPGPEYDPSEKPEYKIQPKYSFGSRRSVPGQDPLIPAVSTTKQVGPGSYLKLDEKLPSTIKDAAKYSFPHEKKFKGYVQPSIQKHETFDTRSAIGPQASSKNTSLAQVSFGHAKKEYFTGIFKAHMSTQPTRVSINMPKY